MKTGYSFSVLRYMHDAMTTEYVNIGVALYAPEVRFFQAICSSHYSRLSKMFGHVDGDHFRKILRYLQVKFDALKIDLEQGLDFGAPAKEIGALLAQVLPPDDSALQFSPAGAGLTSDPAKTLEMLFQRLVAKYADKPEKHSRSDQDIWKVFRDGFEKQKNVLPKLQPKTIVASNYDYEFQHAWKNSKWHAYEPISLDLVEASSIRDKANIWVGRVTSLKDSEDEFKLYLLLGAPQDDKLQHAFIQAENILNQLPCEHVLVKENEVDSFAGQLSAEIGKHGD
jgi:hypothetical protein